MPKISDKIVSISKPAKNDFLYFWGKCKKILER